MLSISIQAIKWVIGKEVDVISMSFALLQELDPLSIQVTAATNAGIVMVCSHHDERPKVEKSWPASYGSNSAMVISARDEYGRMLRDGGTPVCNDTLQGQKVWAGDIPFLDSRESPTGSSVSTAIAAGLLSLILTCDRMANRRVLTSLKRFSMVEQFLKQMKSDTENSNFVVLEKFGGIDKLPGRTGIDAPSILRDRFFSRT